MFHVKHLQGSPHPQSFNRKLAPVAAQVARASGANVTHIELADFDIPIYNADLEAQGSVGGGPPGARCGLRAARLQNP